MGTFRFKQFSVTDDGAAMKTGTDAVLLGAWCPVGQANRILDIGTGSGVIALMLAQRSRPEARIDAVEINAADAQQARENVQRSPWSGKIEVVHAPVQEFKRVTLYDLIITNPPFFSASLLPPDPRRTVARHDTQLTKDELLTAVNRLLGESGIFCLILPFTEAKSFQVQASGYGFYLAHITHFQTRADKNPERTLMAFSREQLKPMQEDRLVLYEGRERKTEAYRNLTADFYL